MLKGSGLGLFVLFRRLHTSLFRRALSIEEFSGHPFILVDLMADGMAELVEVLTKLRVRLTCKAHQQELNLLMFLYIPINIDAVGKMIVTLVRLEQSDKSPHSRQQFGMVVNDSVLPNCPVPLPFLYLCHTIGALFHAECKARGNASLISQGKR